VRVLRFPTALALSVIGFFGSAPIWANSTCPVGDFLSTLDTTSNTMAVGPGPYGDVCVALSGQVATITFTADTNYVFGDGGTAGLQINSTSFTPTSANGSTGFLVEKLGGSDVTSASFKDFSSGNYQAGLGDFNLILDNKSFDTVADTLVFTVTNMGTAWSSVSDVLAANGSGFDAAAHVRWSLGPSGANTTFVTEGAGTGIIVGNPVPEPSFILAAFAGFGLIILFNERRRRRA